MTVDEIMSLADAYATEMVHSHYHPLREKRAALKSAIEELVAAVSAEREACAQVVERDLYPGTLTPYQVQYNAGINAVAAAIRSRT